MSEPIQTISHNNYILQAPPPTATMFTTELEYDVNSKITGYAGTAFAGGGTNLDFGYTDADTISSINTSALTDVSLNNIVQTNSASWGGSALPISAGPGVKINLVNDTLVFSNDETLLWVNPNPQMVISNTTLTAELSDTISSYKKIRFICKSSYDYQESFSAAVMNQDFYTNENNVVNSVGIYLPNRRDDTNYIDCCQIQFSGNVFTANNGIRLQSTNNTERGPYILSAIGIERRV